MSYKAEVQTGRDPKFYSNALRFATEAEALASGRELMGRWLLVVDYRAAPSDDPVNYRFIDGRNVPERDWQENQSADATS